LTMPTRLTTVALVTRTAAISLSVLSLAVTGHAFACVGDAGTYNGACNDGGATWVPCAVHGDCPAEQVSQERSPLAPTAEPSAPRAGSTQGIC
jgi:hypothetical protein